MNHYRTVTQFGSLPRCERQRARFGIHRSNVSHFVVPSVGPECLLRHSRRASRPIKWRLLMCKDIGVKCIRCSELIREICFALSANMNFTHKVFANNLIKTCYYIISWVYSYDYSVVSVGKIKNNNKIKITYVFFR